MSWSRSKIVLIASWLSAFEALHAQYNEPREYQPTEARYFYAGFLQREFTPRATNTTPESVAIAFDRLMPVIGFRQGLVDVTFGYATYTLEGTSRSTVYFGATVAQEVPLSGRRPGTLLLPLMLSADFTKAEGIGFERENFNIASVGLGVGLKYRLVQERLDFSIQALEAVHYSSEGLSVGSGFSAATMGEAVLQLPRTLVFDGIVLGYRYRLQTWAMNNARFNYRSISHGPFLGVMF
jgi:hypothetical protein